MPDLDPFNVLGVARTANAEEIRKAYIARSKILHPDRFDSQKQPKEWAQANEMLSELNRAYADIRHGPDGGERRSETTNSGTQQEQQTNASHGETPQPPIRKKRGWFTPDWERSRGQACFFLLAWALMGFYEGGTALVREFRIDSVPHNLPLGELKRGVIPNNRFLQVSDVSCDMPRAVVYWEKMLAQAYYIPLTSQSSFFDPGDTVKVPQNEPSRDDQTTRVILRLTKGLFDEHSAVLASNAPLTIEGIRLLDSDTETAVKELLERTLQLNNWTNVIVLDGGRQPVGVAVSIKYLVASSALVLLVIAIFYRRRKLGWFAVAVFFASLLIRPGLNRIESQYRSPIIPATETVPTATMPHVTMHTVAPQVLSRWENGTFDIKSLARMATPAIALLTKRNSTGGESGFGTGFFIRIADRTCIVTCLHVVEGAQSVAVRTSLGDEANAKGIYGFDADSDLVILGIDSEPSVYLALGDSTKMEVGERIGVIGNPRGLEGTVSEGIISAKREHGSETKIMQISAPVSSGSSGSPVLNAEGEVCAIATAVVRNAQALNLAVPVESLKNLLNSEATQSAIQNNAVQTFNSVNHRMAKENGLSSLAGAETRNQLAAAVIDGNYLTASRIAKQWIDAHPYDAPAYAALAAHLIKLNDWQAAETAVRNALNYDDGNDRYWKILGDIYRETQKWSAAKSAYYEAVQRNKTDEALLIMLARLSSIEKEYNRVITSFESAMKLNANADVSWWMLAEAYERTGEMEKAIAAYRKEVAAAPSNCYYMCKVALRLAWIGQTREAEKLFSRARIVDPFYHAKVAELARQRSGSTVEVRADRLEKYQMAVALNPEVQSHWFSLAHAWDAAGRSKEADAARESARLNPKTPLRTALEANLRDIQMLMVGLDVAEPANSMITNYGIDAFWPDLWEDCVFTRHGASNQSVALRRKLQERRGLLERQIASEGGVLLHPAIADKCEAE